MATEILMPALSPTMEEGTLSKWLVREGDSIRAGDVIAEIETDKATMEVEAVDEGRVGKLLVAAGTEGVKVNTPIAVILSDGEVMGGGARAPARDGTPLAAAPAPVAAASPTLTIAAASPTLTVAATTPPASREAEVRIAHVPAPPAGPTASAAAKRPAAEPSIGAGTVMRMTTVREALRDAMAEEMRRDGDVFVMGEEVAEYQGAYKVTQGLLEEFGARRVIDTPITEYGFAGVGTGAAFAGLKPVVEFMTFNFAMQAIDHIINSAAKTLYMSGGQMGCPIVFRGPNGAASRVAAQHSQDYSAWYASVPGLKVLAPYTAADAKGLLKSAIRDPNPIVFLENELLYGQSFEVPQVEDWLVPIGKARIARAGDAVTIVAYSRGVAYALEAAEMLAGEGIEAEVIDLRTLRPLDIDTVVESVRRSNRLVTVDEGWPVCSVGTEICQRVTERAFDHLDAPPTRVTGADVPMPYAANLEKLALPSAAKVVAAAKAVLYV